MKEKPDINEIHMRQSGWKNEQENNVILPQKIALLTI